jgi:hypothetical protein
MATTVIGTCLQEPDWIVYEGISRLFVVSKVFRRHKRPFQQNFANAPHWN